MLRPAKRNDLPKVIALLATANLPTADVSEHLGGFVVFESSSSVVGVGGLELHGSFALLRSLAVSPDHQGSGLATAICDHLEVEAASRGVEHLYLLTETAEDFFRKRGWVATYRADAPPEIVSTQEFSAICAQSAVLMRRAAFYEGESVKPSSSTDGAGGG